MTVKELIEKLQECEQDLSVRAVCSNSDVINDATRILYLVQITMSDYEDDNSVVLRYE